MNNIEPINSICLLCGKSGKLAESHIIPKSFDKAVKDEYGKSVRLDFKSKTSRFQKRSPIDSNILCLECETSLLGKLDKYAKEYLLDKLPVRFKQIFPSFSEVYPYNLLLDDLNYNKLKLFILSVMWRAHVSSLPFYEKVDIGEFAPIIKQMLLSGDGGSDYLFEVSIYCILEITGEPLKLIIEPEVTKGNVCRFIFGGYVFLIKLGKVKHEYEQFKLMQPNKLRLGVFKGLQAYKELLNHGIPVDEAKYFTFRIFEAKGNIISMAKNAHFDVLINFCNCDGRQPHYTNSVIEEFGSITGKTKEGLEPSPKDSLGKIATRTVLLQDGKKKLHIVNAYVKLNNTMKAPFNIAALKKCFNKINECYHGLTVGMPHIWVNVIAWDFDHDKMKALINKELLNCRVKIIKETGLQL